MVEKVNNAVVFPHPANWKKRPAWQREWKTSVSSAVTKSEDRSTARTVPYARLEYQILPLSIQESSRLNARVLQALKLGRACAPYHGRAQFLAEIEPDPLPAAESILVGNQYDISGLVVGKTYYYEKGPNDLLALNTVSLILATSGYFTAIFDTVTIPVSSLGQPGTIRRIHLAEVGTQGRWPWEEGQWAFFGPLMSRDNRFTHENLEYLINAGGGASGNWLADIHFTGGSVVTSGSAVNTADVIGYAVPPATVLQSARNLVSADPTAKITYTLSGLKRDLDCRVRLHFAELETGYDGTLARRVMDVGVVGDCTRTAASFEPYHRAGDNLLRASVLDFRCKPDSNGQMTIHLRPKARVEVYTASTVHYNLAAGTFEMDGRLLPVGRWVLLKNQGNPAENGLYVLTDGAFVRAPGYETGEALKQLTAIYVQEGEVNGGEYFRNTNTGTVNVGSTAIAFDVATNPFRAGINAIELYQYSWEVRQLTSGSGANNLRWSGWLKGYYPRGTKVSPLFFGRPEVTSAGSEAGRFERIGLSLQEPMGDGVAATPGSCPVETCEEGAGGPGWFDGGDPGALTCSGAGIPEVFYATYYWGVLPGVNPNDYIAPEQVACHLALSEAAYEAEKAAHPGSVYTQGPWYWRLLSLSNGFSMQSKHASGNCVPYNGYGDNVVAFGGNALALARETCRLDP